MPGKVRGPAVVIILCVVTLGIYWWVWTRRSFGEVAEHRARNLPTMYWGIALGAWVGTILVAAYRIPDQLGEIGRSPGSQPPNFMDSIRQSLEDQYAPLGLAVIGLGAVMYLMQMAYLRPANELVREVAERMPGTAVPSTGMVLTFTLLIVVGSAVPIIGGFFAIAGGIIAIIWIAQVQQAMNRYWEVTRRATVPPPSVGMPSPIMMPPR